MTHLRLYILGSRRTESWSKTHTGEEGKEGEEDEREVPLGVVQT